MTREERFYDRKEDKLPAERLRTLTTIIDRNNLADYVETMEGYLLEMEGFGRCDCCKQVVYKDLVTNLLDDTEQNNLDLFVCETCKERI